MSSVLGLTLGAMVEDHRIRLILWVVPAAAFLATITGLMAIPADAYMEDGPRPELTYILFVVICGVPVIVGALVGALWRLVLGLLAARSARA